MQQEAAAISFELKILKQLQYVGNNTDEWGSMPYPDLRKLSDIREAFYQQCLWRVHLFELALYRCHNIKVQQLDNLWALITGREVQFGTDWRYQSHLYLAPFYTVCYPFAISANA